MLGLMEIAPNFNLLLLSLKPTKSSSSFNCFDLVHLLHEIDEIERTTYDAISKSNYLKSEQRIMRLLRRM